MKQKYNPIGYVIAINFILFFIIAVNIFEVFFFTTTIPWTDANVPPSQLTINSGVNPSLLDQDMYLGFNYWIFVSNIFRLVTYVIGEYVFLSNLRSKIAYAFCFILYVLSGLFDFLKFGYFLFILLSCADYVVCRGRAYSGSSKFKTNESFCSSNSLFNY